MTSIERQVYDITVFIASIMKTLPKSHMGYYFDKDIEHNGRVPREKAYVVIMLDNWRRVARACKGNSVTTTELKIREVQEEMVRLGFAVDSFVADGVWNNESDWSLDMAVELGVANWEAVTTCPKCGFMLDTLEHLTMCTKPSPR